MKTIDTRVLAFVEANPSCTARDVGEMLGNAASKSRERSQAHAALGRLRDIGMIEGRDWPARWTAIKREPIHDPEYVEIVLERLSELRAAAPERLHHAIDYCCVDLQRALGRAPG